MKSIKTLYFICFVLCFSYSKAQQAPPTLGPGCQVNDMVYQMSIGTYDGVPLFMGIGNQCSGTFFYKNSSYWNETGGNASCYVWIDCSGTDKKNYKKGKIGSVVGVPIDNYVLPLLALISVFVFFRLRKQQLSY